MTNHISEDDFLPLEFVSEDEPSPAATKRGASEETIIGEEDFSSLDGAFTSIEESEEFKGFDGDVDRHIPPTEVRGSSINEYGVKVRAGKRSQPLKDDDEIQFSVNLGDG